MSTAPLDAPLVPSDSVSIARLHGEACWHCGTTGTLHGAGQVATTIPGGGGVQVWPIVACLPHRDLGVR